MALDGNVYQSQKTVERLSYKASVSMKIINNNNSNNISNNDSNNNSYWVVLGYFFKY